MVVTFEIYFGSFFFVCFGSTIAFTASRKSFIYVCYEWKYSSEFMHEYFHFDGMLFFLVKHNFNGSRLFENPFSLL